MKLLRIALTVPSLRGGGLERVVRDLALALRARGHDVAVFPVSGLGTYAETLHAHGVPVFDCQEVGFRVRGYPRRLLRSLRRWEPDIIHAHSGTWFPAAMSAWRLGTPGPALIFTDHGRYPPETLFRSLTERWSDRHTARVVTVSTALAEYVQRFLKRPSLPDVIHNGIDLAPFGEVAPEARTRLRKEWGLGTGATMAIMVGRFVPVKNHIGVLRAFAVGAPDHGRLALLGAGPLEPDVRAEVQRLGITQRVLFLGFRSDVAECLSASDLWLSGSTTEGLPISLLEAMASGLPILATAVGGVPEALGSPPAGVLIPPNDIESFGRELGALMSDDNHRTGLGRQARVQSEAFSLARMTDQYCDLYEAVLRRRAPQ